MAGTVVVVGAGPIGLLTAMLVAREGHQVTVLDKDAQYPPAGAEEAWRDWERSGVAQFRQQHGMQPKFGHLLGAELPDVLDHLEASGARRFNLLDALPPSIKDRSRRPGDQRFETVTGRRPVLESAIARVAEGTPGVRIVRGVAVDGPVTGASVRAGVPHVSGVRTKDGKDICADLVIDAMGRRSRLCDWVVAMGGRRPYEEAADVGFAYYSRHYRSRDGSLPEFRGPVATELSTIKVFTMPTDNDTWVVSITALAGDKPLKALRHNGTWESVVRATPHAAHWIDAEALGDVAPMAGVMDRCRRLVVGHAPVVTGVVAVGDAWACTNPNAGRGMSLGLAHAVALRDVLRESPHDPAHLTEEFDKVTEETLTPWYRHQVDADHLRAAEVQAVIKEVPDPPDGESATSMKAAFRAAATLDPDVARAALDVISCLALPAEVMGRPGTMERVAGYAGVEPAQMPGPTRAELVALMI